MSFDLVEKVTAGKVDTDVVDWLSRGFSAWQAGDVGLDKCLQLDRVGMLRHRNAALIEAARLLDKGKGAWHTAGLLTKAIARHESDVAPILRRNPNHEIGAIDHALRLALIDPKCIKSHKRLYDLLK